MTPDERNQALRRLSRRGRLEVRMELRQKKVREDWDGHSTTTWIASSDEPWWIVHLARPTTIGTGWTRLVLDMIGWNDIYIESMDLDQAITDALEQSRPHQVWLDDHVYEHLHKQREEAAEART